MVGCTFSGSFGPACPTDASPSQPPLPRRDCPSDRITVARGGGGDVNQRKIVGSPRRACELLLGLAALTGCGETVEPPGPTVASVDVVSPIDTVVAQGKAVQLTATARDAAGDTVAGAAFSWTSSAPATASVSATGLVTGLAAGATEITAEAAGVQGQLRMRVVVADLAGIGTVLTDPFMARCLTAATGAEGTLVHSLIDSAVTEADQGYLLALRRHLASARTAAGTATAANDRALLAVVDLMLGVAQERLGF
jgi:hypothetical protein